MFQKMLRAFSVKKVIFMFICSLIWSIEALYTQTPGFLMFSGGKERNSR